MIHVFSRVATHCTQRFGSAALAGAAMGWVVWMLSRNEERLALNLMFALVVVVCGSTSFVLFAMHRLEQAGRPTLAQRFAEARSAATALGVTLTLALVFLQGFWA